MASHSEILNLLQRNADYNDNSGSTAGARPRRRVVKRAAGARKRVVRKRKVGASSIGGRKRKVVHHRMTAGRKRMGVRRKAGGARTRGHPRSVRQREERSVYPTPHVTDFYSNVVGPMPVGLNPMMPAEFSPSSADPLVTGYGYIGGEYIGGCEHCMKKGSMCHHCMMGHGMYVGGRKRRMRGGKKSVEFEEGMLREELDELKEELDHLRDEVYELKCY